MTEEEWDEGTHPSNMMGEAIHFHSSTRKLRLLAAALCRRVGRIDDAELIERASVGEVVTEEIVRRHRFVAPAPIRRNTWSGNPARLRKDYQAAQIAAAALNVDPFDAAQSTVHEAFAWLQAELNEFIRCVFCNPFRPVAFDPAWRTEHTVGIAGKMYDDRDFAAMPILADALEEAGCENPDILAHCRGPGVHVRGCWVVDLVLGKS